LLDRCCRIREIAAAKGAASDIGESIDDFDVFAAPDGPGRLQQLRLRRIREIEDVKLPPYGIGVGSFQGNVVDRIRAAAAYRF